jgi:hypothetical protein
MSLRAQRGNLVAILSDMQSGYALATRLPRHPITHSPAVPRNDIWACCILKNYAITQL